MVYISYERVGRSEFRNNVSAKDRVEGYKPQPNKTQSKRNSK